MASWSSFNDGEGSPVEAQFVRSEDVDGLALVQS